MMFSCWMPLLVRRVQGCYDGKGESRTAPPQVSRLVGILGNRKLHGTVILSKDCRKESNHCPKKEIMEQNMAPAPSWGTDDLQNR